MLTGWVYILTPKFMRFMSADYQLLNGGFIVLIKGEYFWVS